MSRMDGMNYAPQGKLSPVCRPGDFTLAAAHLDHGHIYGQCNGLLEAGGELKWVYDPDRSRVGSLLRQVSKRQAGLQPWRDPR